MKEEQVDVEYCELPRKFVQKNVGLLVFHYQLHTWFLFFNMQSWKKVQEDLSRTVVPGTVPVVW